jgi:hypothetical protein
MQAALTRPDPYGTDAEWAAEGISLPSDDAEYDVVHVEVIGPLTLHVRHADGVEGTVRFEESHLRGVFVPLRDPAFFAKAVAEYGAVRWPDDLDISPDNMHRHLFAYGEWVLGSEVQ